MVQNYHGIEIENKDSGNLSVAFISASDIQGSLEKYM